MEQDSPIATGLAALRALSRADGKSVFAPAVMWHVHAVASAEVLSGISGAYARSAVRIRTIRLFLV